MKQRAFKEQVFKLLFRAEFNTREELLEQLPFYFDAGDMTVSVEDRGKGAASSAEAPAESM